MKYIFAEAASILSSNSLIGAKLGLPSRFPENEWEEQGTNVTGSQMTTLHSPEYIEPKFRNKVAHNSAKIN